MRRVTLFPRFVLLAILGASPALAAVHAQGFHAHHAPKEVRQEITDLEEQWKKATLAGDVTTIASMLSDDYVGISWNGQVNTKATQLDRVRTRTFAVTQMDLSDVKIKVVGRVAIVTATANLEGSNEGAPLKGQFRYTRVYQRTPSGDWKITSFEATRVPRSKAVQASASGQ